jgi:hypothetical protein
MGRLVLALVLSFGCLAAQSVDLSILNDHPDAVDRPVGGIVMRLPAGGSTGNVTPSPNPTPPPTPNPPPVVNPPPPEWEPPEPPPPPPIEEPPTYYGEPVRGNVLFVLDASGSMAWGSPTRIHNLRVEIVNVISQLTENDFFDCIAFGDQFGIGNHYCRFLWGALMPATENNKTNAINWIMGPTLTPGSGTPAYAALKRACETSPKDLDKMFFVSDGYPNTSGNAARILSDFPGWWNKFENTTFIAICIGGGGAHFMQQLAALADGKYIAV